jgi:putative sterol carrier protein
MSQHARLPVLMAIELPSEADDWIRQWRRQLNDNPKFAQGADGWGVGFNGDFLFEIQPDDTYSGDPLRFAVELEDSECTSVAKIDHPREADHGFALRGTYTDWKQLIRGELGVVDAIMGGGFDVEGSKLKLMQYQDAAVAMAETAAAVDTDFEY